MSTIYKVTALQGGFEVVVEVAGAYTKPQRNDFTSPSTSRFDRVFVPREQLGEMSRAEIVAAVRDVLSEARTVSRQRGVDIDAESVDRKEVWLAKIRQAVSDWRDVRDVRIEGEARSAPPAVIADVQAAEDALWDKVAGLVQQWRNAS